MSSVPTFQWHAMDERLACVGNNGFVFSDTLEHWTDGVLRLLGWDDERGRAWVETVGSARLGSCAMEGYHERCQRLIAGTRTFLSLEPPDRTAANIWFRGDIAGAPGAVWMGDALVAHARLVDEESGEPLPAPLYEEEYFEGSVHRVGYGGYAEQGGWRMQKARRQVRQIQGFAQAIGLPIPEAASVLDVGSGYGFFREAAGRLGWEHHGVEVSKHAAARAEAHFGFTTFVGTLDEYAIAHEEHTARFSLVTMFDVIEHVSDPATLVKTAARLLKPGGILAVRTPNLTALEGVVFGPYYHSLKPEHLHLFSAHSLSECIAEAGLESQLVMSEAHLFRGFLQQFLSVQSATLAGSDLFAVATKPKF